ncbi:hypothetical protein SISSUDRAFT_1063092 [Sistotremastrum suecicum HHB10207 ss-3]|uniref:WW domain-containing protein n=1 Tax=Sistotremastrum suecicum HHB10207 ss-3 TaxID=1314776 RepID=A0A166C6Q4_9AGAM|nr:hypothetical protein SISSUDRAFT_1063092 [Sistotremastrum suecicum HHB10207 ss-3]
MGDERPLPPGWTRYHDLATGKFFWVNKLVRPHEYSWVHPLDINPSPKQSPPPALQISWDGKTYGKGLRISWHGKTKSGADQPNFLSTKDIIGGLILGHDYASINVSRSIGSRLILWTKPVE